MKAQEAVFTSLMLVITRHLVSRSKVLISKFDIQD